MPEQPKKKKPHQTKDKRPLKSRVKIEARRCPAAEQLDMQKCQAFLRRERANVLKLVQFQVPPLMLMTMSVFRMLSHVKPQFLVASLPNIMLRDLVPLMARLQLVQDDANHHQQIRLVLGHLVKAGALELVPIPGDARKKPYRIKGGHTLFVELFVP